MIEEPLTLCSAACTAVQQSTWTVRETGREPFPVVSEGMRKKPVQGSAQLPDQQEKKSCTLERHFTVRALHITILTKLHVKHSLRSAQVQGVLTVRTLEKHRERYNALSLKDG